MKIKAFFLFIFIIFSSILSQAQFLHFGVKTYTSPYLYLEFYKYNQNEYVFYFANEQNETIRFDGIKDSQIKSLKPYPSIFLRYDKGVRWFFEFGAYYFWFKNEASYQNSVDLADYSSIFNSANNQQILDYNSLQLKWRFAGNQFLVGYVLMKSKSIRPFIFTGLSSMYLMNLKMGDTYRERNYRDNIVFNHLATFAPLTFYNTTGFGLQFHGIRLSFYTLRSVGNIDIYALDYKKNSSLTVDQPHPNYKYLQGGFISLSLNIFSVNTQKSSFSDEVSDMF